MLYGKITVEDYKEVRREIYERSSFKEKIKIFVNSIKIIVKKDQDDIKVYIPKVVIDDSILGFMNKIGNDKHIVFCRSSSRNSGK